MLEERGIGWLILFLVDHEP